MLYWRSADITGKGKEVDVRRSINTKIWCDEWFENLTPEEKLIWLYLLTNQQTNMLGVYEISIRKMAFEIGLSEDQVRDSFQVFEESRKAFYYDGFVILTNWLKNQSLNSNMRVAAVQLYNRLPNSLKDRINANPLKGFESLYEAFRMLPKKEKEIEIEKEKEILPEKASIDFERIVEGYHSLCPDLPRVTKLTEQRKSHLRARIKDQGEEKLNEVFRMAGASDFLCGRKNGDWKANLDWILNPTNFFKILEGNYNNANESRNETTERHQRQFSPADFQ